VRKTQNQDREQRHMQRNSKCWNDLDDLMNERIWRN
jgi:hypothetical protein